MTEVLQAVQPACFTDLALSIRLHFVYLTKTFQVFANQELVEPPQWLKTIFKPSRGTLLFKEQAISIIRKLTDFTGFDSYEVLDSIRDTQAQDMEFEQSLLEGARRNGLSEEDSIELLRQLKHGKLSMHAHDLSMAWLGLRSAWLKVHYPEPFYEALNYVGY